LAQQFDFERQDDPAMKGESRSAWHRHSTKHSFLIYRIILSAYFHTNSRRVKLDARPAMVIVVAVTVMHVDAIAVVEAACSAKALITDLAANAIRVGGRSECHCSSQRRSCGRHECDFAHVITSSW
jgi:hypothetical protein